MSQTQYDADNYLVSTVRALKDYLVNNLDPELYEVVSEFPGVEMHRRVPQEKVVVHIILDDEMNEPVGFGSETRYTYNGTTFTTQREEATARFMLNFDIGIWSWQESGGATARMEVQQILKSLFLGGAAVLALSEVTGGIRAASFSGGRHIQDRIGDVTVWRTVDMTLVADVFGRHVPPTSDAITAIEQVQNTIIDGDAPPTGGGVPVTTP